MKNISRTKKISILIGLALFSIFCCILVSLFSPDTNKENTIPTKTESIVIEIPKVTNTLEYTSTLQPTNTIEYTPTSEPTKDLNLFLSGTYLVGKEILPGLYHGTDNNCYWERLSDLSGEFDSIIANGSTNGSFYIEIKDTDVAFSTTCSVKLFSPNTEPNIITQLNPGQYLIGYDILPGLYKGNADSESCYWERLSNALGDFDSIITNDITDSGQFFVEVKDNDFMFSTGCNLEKVQ